MGGARVTEGYVVDLGRDAVYVVLLVSAPVLLLGLVVGLVVSVFQATTQIQDQTLSFVPKIVAALLAVVIFGSWMLRTLIDFTGRLFASLPQVMH